MTSVTPTTPRLSGLATVLISSQRVAHEYYRRVPARERYRLARLAFRGGSKANRGCASIVRFNAAASRNFAARRSDGAPLRWFARRREVGGEDACRHVA